MKLGPIVAMVGGALLSASVASAEGEMAKPAAELDGMKFFLGAWKCDGKMLAGAMGPGSPEAPYRATLKFKRDKTLGDFWFVGEYEIKKGKGNPGMKAAVSVGYDAAAKRFVGVGVDSTGGYRHDSSAGWQGDKFVIEFEGAMMGKKVTGKETLTKKSDKEFTTAIEVGGNKLTEDVCKR